MSVRSVSFVLVGTLGFATFFYFKYNQHLLEKYPPVKEVSISLPDYSDLEINELVTRLRKEGKGPVLKEADQVSVLMKVWIYDPGAPHNKAGFVYETPEAKPDLFYVEGELIDKQVGATYEFIVPENVEMPGKGMLYEQVKGSFLLIELKIKELL